MSLSIDHYLQINSSGILYLGPDSSTNDEKYIAPFHGDVADSGTGSVFYRSTSNTTLVQQVTDVITSSFTGASAPTFSSLFITTWHQIPKGQPASEVMYYFGRRLGCGQERFVLFVHLN